MIELYLGNSEGGIDHCIILNIQDDKRIYEDIGNLIIGSVRSGSLSDPVAAGKLFATLMGAIFKRDYNKGGAGDVFSCGNSLLVGRKNFVAGVDADGFYTRGDKQTSGKKIRKLELDDIAKVVSDNDEVPEVPF